MEPRGGSPNWLLKSPLKSPLKPKNVTPSPVRQGSRTDWSPKTVSAGSVLSDMAGVPAITLHKLDIVPDDENSHVFTFIFEYPDRMPESHSVESSEIHYGGHRWSLVCMRKEERYLGAFLKWRYSDGQSAQNVSCKTKYTLGLIHRHEYANNKYFTSTQKFSSSQSLLGKSKFVPMSELLDLTSGFVDETGKRVVLEVTLYKCTSRYEKEVDTSARARTRKNASGYYFDTPTFLLSSQRWFLRVYPTKTNANGLPAVYFYLSSKARGISMEVTFRLYLGEDTTDTLTYHFGEGAKYDGFGKTLPEPIYNVDKTNSVITGVEVSSVLVYKDVPITLRSNTGVYSPHVYKEYGSSYGSGGGRYKSLTPTEAFQDHEGNHWKMDLDRERKGLTLVFDKGVHHYPQNKTKLLCWTSTLLTQDPNRGQDMEMSGPATIGYFSNFIDDKGYLMSFAMESAELEERGSPYTGENGEIYFRLYFLSLQTVPVGMRSIPKFDYQAKHLLRAKNVLQERHRSLEEMREMAASRASLSCLESPRDDRLPSESSSGSKMHLYKSYDSLDGISNSDMMLPFGDDDFGKGFFSDVLQHVASLAVTSPADAAASCFVTTRDVFHGTREDVSTESGITMSDESSLLMEARPSPVDLGKQKEIVNMLVKFLQQRMPLRISEVLETGSLGTGTSTRSRMDVDLIVFSPDLPRDNQSRWMPALLHALSNFMQTSCTSPEPFFPFPKSSGFTYNQSALQFTCGGMDVDVMVSRDWETDDGGGYDALYPMSCQQTTPDDRRWYALAASRLQHKFISCQPNEVKEIIKVVKHWRNCIQWRKLPYRPNSYLLSLLVIKAVEETRSFEMKAVLQKAGSYVMTPELSISWSTYYLPDKYPVEFEPPSPLVRDPANPGFNVAETLPYWGQFRTEYSQWLKGLGIPVSDVIAQVDSPQEGTA